MRKWITFDYAPSREMENLLVSKAAECGDALVLTDMMPSQTGCYNKLKKEQLLAGFDSLETFEFKAEELNEHLVKNDWYLGYLAYDLKNELHTKVPQTKNARVTFPNVYFFRPRWIIRNAGSNWELGYDPQHDSHENATSWLKNLLCRQVKTETKPQSILFKPSTTKEEYLNHFNALQNHIRRGDIYELNYCIEFYTKNSSIDPAVTFQKLMELSPMPFSAFLKHGQKYALSASPERYLAKRGNLVYSMPMKGTAPRGKDDTGDNILAQNLLLSEKERSENIMITDLVRNDLSHVASRGSIKVEELCGVYTFPNVFQMVSTISAKLKNPNDWLAPILSSFPMGSMTGAPKLSAMQLIDKHEACARGLFSGAIGYISPEKDFDFNVVIRSLFYDSDTKTISFSAGSAITALANADEEYNECMLKAEVISKKLFSVCP
jgi:para-aminobenzoate synthetase component I